MSLDALNTVDIIDLMERCLEARRPPENMRKQIDLGYRLEDQSVILTEIRPVWEKPGEYREYDYAKTTFVKTLGTWKIYWKRGDLKWHVYDPNLEVKTLEEFLDIVDEDVHHCFKG
ncbi:MAG: DUF3024 domain-containing protein [Bacteroidota bacterium]